MTGLAFSENGYHLASASADGRLKLWDLRKLAAFHTLEPAAAGEGSGLLCVQYDYSGRYLAVGGAGAIRVLDASAGFEVLASLAGHTAAVTGVRWGRDAGLLVSSSLDRTVKVWTPQ